MVGDSGRVGLIYISYTARRHVMQPLEPKRRNASSNVCVPKMFVRTKRPGSRTARPLCDSAAKFTMMST